MITLDIESGAIIKGAPLLPKPVGIALRYEDGNSVYISFGHPSGNTHTWDEAREILMSIWGQELLTHNGATFDIPVLQYWFELPEKDPLSVHDTLFLTYLFNPHAKSLSLKLLAESLLGEEPDEQTELHDWIVKNVPECRAVSKAGAYICRAPADLVGRYAIADVRKTFDLYCFLQPRTEGMKAAYDRERMLAPILADLQNRGVRCDLEALRRDAKTAELTMIETDAYIRSLLNAPTLDLAKRGDVVEVLVERGFSGFHRTPTSGKLSASKESLEAALQESDPTLLALLTKRSTYATLLQTFIRPWIEIAEANDGRIHAAYNQVRNPDGFGTRTGRLSSSSPNFQNVPKDLGDEYPNMRSYLLPDEGDVWVCGDFKSQEPRITAHYENGSLLKAFQEDPSLDPYTFVSKVLKVERHEAKQVLLGFIYSMGAAALAERIGCSEQRARELKAMVVSSIPDIERLSTSCKVRFERGLAIRTLGGRIYHCEPPSNGRSWAYKALNTLIQGSASDQTKEAIIHIHNGLAPGERLLGTVHDEISVSCKEGRVSSVMGLMSRGANILPCRCPMLMDSKFGDTWSGAK